MSIPLDFLLIKHMFRFASTKMRALYAPIMNEMKIRDNCMWYFHPKHNLMLHVLKTGSWEEYNEYITLCNHKDHTQQIFESLVETFDENKITPISVEWNGSYLIVNDGCHRLAVMMHKGIITDSIPLKYLSITINDKIIKDLQTLLQSTTGYTVANGWNNRGQNGYQSLQLYNMNLVGQRNCLQRINEMRSVYDFTGKTIVDLGCNVGGMLHHIQEGKFGIGVEYDKRSVEVAKQINRYLGPLLLPSIFFDLNLDTPEAANSTKMLLQNYKPDVVFLLSLGSWIKRWRELYSSVEESVKYIFLEVNNESEGRDQLTFFSEKGWKITPVNEFSSDDTTGNKGRRLYLLTK